MRRYYFDLVISGHVGEDDEGVILVDLDAAQKEALRTLADAAKEFVGVPADMAIQVRDDDGVVMRVSVAAGNSAVDLHQHLLVAGFRST